MTEGASGTPSPVHEPAQRGEPAWGFAYIVVPVLGRLFGAGEVDSVRVRGERAGARTRQLSVYIDALGDSGSSMFWDSVSPLRDEPLVGLRVQLADQLQDLIAESPRGWGQLRTFAPSDFE